MKRGRRPSKFKVGDVVWGKLNGQYSSYRNIMHPGKVEEVIDNGLEFTYKVYLTHFERQYATSFDVFTEYQIFCPEAIVPFKDPKYGDVIWFEVEKRMVDGELVDWGNVYLKGIVIKTDSSDELKCLFDPCEQRESWKEIVIPRANAFMILE